MNSPVFDEIENTNNTGKIIPIYPLTFSLTQNTLRKIITHIATSKLCKYIV